MVKKEQRKSFVIRESGRSTDYIAPSFGRGCLLDCTYCYMKRNLPDKEVKVARNPEDVLTAINDHVTWLPPKIPNQTDPVYYTYDIACNEDFALHAKYHKWKFIFDFFKNHKLIKASLATKIIPIDFLSYNPAKKVRIRFSLMPQVISSQLEPNTPPIIDRIKAIDAFIDAGYDVHVNFSPVVVYPNWIQNYKELFEMLDTYVDYKDEVQAEVIFLTHNEEKHRYNVTWKKSGESLLWQPGMQENKQSQYGGENIRYRHDLKSQFIHQFRELHSSVIPWNTIRYIF